MEKAADKRLEKMEKNITSLIETVGFIKDHMVTKEEFAELKTEIRNDLSETEDRLHAEIVSKVGGMGHRLDEELDKRKLIEVRVTTLERKVASL